MKELSASTVSQVSGGCFFLRRSSFFPAFSRPWGGFGGGFGGFSGGQSTNTNVNINHIHLPQRSQDFDFGGDEGGCE